MITNLPQVQSDDRVLNQFQQNVSNFAQQVQIIPILNGNLIRGIVLVAGQVNTINHGLPGKLIGWIVTRNLANSNLWDTQDDNPQVRTLLINCSANTTVDLWVF